MPDISKFKSVSVSTDTHDKLMSMAQKRFEVPVSVQKVIEFLLEKELKKKNGRSNGNTTLKLFVRDVREMALFVCRQAAHTR